MTDLELLEAAAKAAGVNTLSGCGDFDIYSGSPLPYWNPLTDDGDALRLAVKLAISVMQPTPEDRGVAVTWEGGGAVHKRAAQDPYAATRRAIVRAAASIGRKQ